MQEAEEQAWLRKEKARQVAKSAVVSPPQVSEGDVRYSLAKGVDAKVNSLKRRTRAGSLVLSIDHAAGELRLDGEYVDTALGSIAEDLSESRPNYIVHIFPWAREDGRVQYPFCLIAFMPAAVPPNLRVLYTRPAIGLRDLLACKLFFCEDMDDVNDDWLTARLRGDRA